ncbi:MAG: protein kinase domain-containing protein [Hyphomicrobiales bacterium]
MALPSGSRIGNYEVLASHGSGGMGEVYRARDTRLDRTVAIKALPPAFAADPSRLARFEREAKLLASLSHANIAHIYGLEEVGGAPYLVLEFVEGETLAQRIAQGPLTARETLQVGGQIASAIEAAHARGIVHRDLKPNNIMLSATGAVKVLDFGLAKGGATEESSSQDLMASPTMALSETGQGVIIGTAPYMSPEQARGRKVDRRTDVWALGCVLFECLAGRQAFEGETVSDVIARIIEREPEWSAIPPATPSRLRDLIQRCLTKDAEERPRDVGDLRRELNAIAMQMTPSSGVIAAAPAEVPSLAVLYFENLASDKESEYFCAGITEDILTDLSKIKGLRVASRNAVLRYRGAPVDLEKVAADLGVKSVLEGSVRRAGDRVRITVQLVNAADGFHVWAERYDRTLADVFAVQEEIAKSIAEALRVALSPAETESLAKNRPDDVRAYDLYLKGRARYGSYTPESLREALDLFQQAIAIDPEYALAWAGVADCHGQMLQYELSKNPEETVHLGLEAASRAIALDPRLAEGHKAEALVRRYKGDREGSVAALRRAIAANPRYTPAIINLAVESMSDANAAAAERYLRRALEIDPQEAFATAWLGQVLWWTSRDDELMALVDRLRGLSDDPFYVTAGHAFRGLVFLRRGDLAAAERLVREGLADGAEAASMHAVEAAIAARTGREADVRRLLAEVERAPRVSPQGLAMAAAAAIRIADFDVALRLLDRAFMLELGPWIVRLEPELHALADRAPYAPRRAPVTLVWPLEAAMIDAARFALFQEVRIESGLPQGSEVA